MPAFLRLNYSSRKKYNSNKIDLKIIFSIYCQFKDIYNNIKQRKYKPDSGMFSTLTTTRLVNIINLQDKINWQLF